MESFSEARQALERQRKRIQWMFGLHVAVYAAALGLLFVSQPAGILAGLANAAYYLFLLRRRMKAYDSAMARACVVYGLCAPWRDAGYADRGSLTPQALRELQILPLRDTETALLSLHGFTAATADGSLRVEGSEITLHYPAEVGGRNSFKFLSGTLLTARYPGNGAGGDCLLLAKGLLEPRAQETFLAQCGYHPGGTEIEGFSLYHHAPDAALPGTVTRRVEKLIKGCPTAAAVRLCQSGASIYFKGRFYTGRYRPNIAPAEGLLRQNGLPERDEAMAFFRFCSQFKSD